MDHMVRHNSYNSLVRARLMVALQNASLLRSDSSQFSHSKEMHSDSTQFSHACSAPPKEMHPAWEKRGGPVHVHHALAEVFTDSAFPLPANAQGWCRVKDLKGVGHGTPCVFKGIISSDQIKQGMESVNCWLLAAIAGVAEFPGHVKDLFHPQRYAESGRYEVMLYDIITEAWTPIEIDDRIPVTSGNVPCFCQVPSNGSVWPLLLEKAVAKFVGSYDGLQWGDPGWAYQVLTGVPEFVLYERVREGTWGAYVVDRQSLCSDLGSENWRQSGMRVFADCQRRAPYKFTSPLMFQHLAYLDQCESLLSAGISDSFHVDDSDGLIVGHMYSVLDVQKAHGMCMIKLRNPFGDQEWNGDFSDKSERWNQHPQLKEDLAHTSDDHDGSFWMCWSDFERLFDRVCVAPANLRMPKQGCVATTLKTNSSQSAQIICPRCNAGLVRLWMMTGMSECGENGKWERLEDGDPCVMCLRISGCSATTEPYHLREQLHTIPGINCFAKFPNVFVPPPPRAKAICRYGEACYRHDPDHYLHYDHPCLGYRIVDGKLDAPGLLFADAEELLEVFDGEEGDVMLFGGGGPVIRGEPMKVSVWNAAAYDKCGYKKTTNPELAAAAFKIQSSVIILSPECDGRTHRAFQACSYQKLRTPSRKWGPDIFFDPTVLTPKGTSNIHLDGVGLSQLFECTRTKTHVFAMAIQARHYGRSDRLLEAYHRQQHGKKCDAHYTEILTKTRRDIGVIRDVFRTIFKSGAKVHRVIIGGDFNELGDLMQNYPDEFRPFPHSLMKNAFCTRVGHTLKPVPPPLGQCDQIWVAKGNKMISHERGDRFGSDHHSVTICFD